MFQFFVEDSSFKGDYVEITGSDLNHMKNVVRLKLGEKFRVSLPDGKNYLCQVEGYSEEAGLGKVLSEMDSTELSGRIILYQGLPKSDKLELIIQKCTELGVTDIVPVRMKNSVVKLDDKKAESKVMRWQAIAEAAAKQSKRSVIPTVHPVMSFKEAVKDAENNGINLVPYENQKGISYTKEVLSRIGKNTSVGVFVGPEGGFDNKEIDLVKEEMELISLGRRILRTETAAITMASLLMMQMEED